MPRHIDHEISRRIDEKIIAGYNSISENSRAFIAGGEEVAFSYFIVEGKIRVDGKLIVGTLLNFGTIKVEGELETDPDLE